MRNIMKVLWVTSSYPRGRNDILSPFLHELAKRLAKSEIEIHVLTPSDKGLQKVENLGGVIIHRYNYFIPGFQRLTYGSGMAVNLKESLLAKFQLLPYFIFTLINILRLLNREKFDVVHAHWAFPSGYIVSVARNILNFPVVLTLHGTEIFLVKKFKIARPFISYSLKNSDIILSNSNYTKEKADEIFKNRNNLVLPMGVDTLRFKQISRQEIDNLKVQLNLENKFIILTICRLIKRKGVNYLINALSELKEYKDIALMIIGDGPEKENLKKLAEELKVDDRIVFQGKVSPGKIHQFHQICDIETLVSITDESGETEGLGVVLIEGAACGKPLIGSQTGGIVDIITNGYNGFLIPEKDSKKIAENIILLYKDRDLIKEMGMNSRKIAEEKFSWDSIVEKHIDIYESHLKKNKAYSK